MKKFIFPILLFILFPKVESQIVFCPPGAEWHYTFYYHDGSYNNEKIKYVRDSVIDNETVKVLQHQEAGKWENISFPMLSLVKQRGDTIFFRNLTTQHNWQILYNYAALPGQSWQNIICVSNTNPTTLTATYTVIVTAITYTSINSVNLRQLHVNYYSQAVPSPSGYESVIITERFGCDEFMFNFYFQVTYHIKFENFLCYQDDSFGLSQFTDKPCTYSDFVGIVENYQNTNINVFPNPSHDFFTISVGNERLNGKCIVSIKDLYGREIIQDTINNVNSGSSDFSNCRINIEDLPKGVYVLSLKNQGGEIYTGKLVKSG